MGDENYSAGDFRSNECIELLKQADIVVTNPPFFLFREYIAQLIEYKKKFLIIGNVNAISYKDCFKLIKNNFIWLGQSIHSGDREFQVPDDYPQQTKGYRVDKETGKKYIRVKGVRWFTNLDYKERHEDLIPKKYRKYNPTDYPKYENYDAINVGKVELIPIDYNDSIGVPITFLDKWNPSQFEIQALGIVGSITFSNNRKMKILDKKTGEPKYKINKKTDEKQFIYTTNAKGTLYIKFNPNKKISKENNRAFQDDETGEIYSSIYARIIIKRKPIGE
jgi:hypothetical protein